MGTQTSKIKIFKYCKFHKNCIFSRWLFSGPGKSAKRNLSSTTKSLNIWKCRNLPAVSHLWCWGWHLTRKLHSLGGTVTHSSKIEWTGITSHDGGGLAHLGLVISSSLLTTHQAYNKSKKISHRSSESVSFLSQASMLFLHGSLRNCLSRHLRVFVSSQKFEACLSQSPQFWLMVDKGNSSSMASFEHQRKEPTSCSHAEGKLSWGVEVEIQVSCNGWCISLSNPGMKSRDFAGTCKSNVANGWAQPLVPHERPLYLCYFQTVLDSTRGFHVGEDVMVFLTSMSTFLTSTSTFFSCWEWRWHQVHELQMCSRCWLQLDFCTQQFKMAFMRSSVLFIDTSINQSRTLFSVTLWTANV